MLACAYNEPMQPYWKRKGMHTYRSMQGSRHAECVPGASVSPWKMSSRAAAAFAALWWELETSMNLRRPMPADSSSTSR
jgi:hypothetical protein